MRIAIADDAVLVREGDEPLLCAVVQVSLQPTPLRVCALDDACTRRAELHELGAQFGGQALVLEAEPGRRNHVLDPGWIGEHGPVVQ